METIPQVLGVCVKQSRPRPRCIVSWELFFDGAPQARAKKKPARIAVRVSLDRQLIAAPFYYETHAWAQMLSVIPIKVRGTHRAWLHSVLSRPGFRLHD